MKMPSRAWFERMASVDDSEMSVGGLASRVTELESSAPAASGAAGTEPVAWICEWSDHTALYDSLAIAEVDADGDIVPQPLYRSPPQPASGWLSTEEREAVEFLASLDQGQYLDGPRKHARVAKALLARSSPPEVVLPPAAKGETPLVRDLMWGQAIRAAGVTLKEVGK